MKGFNAIRCQNKRWDYSPPTCVAFGCGRLPEPHQGKKVEETTTFFGGKVVFQCNKAGYELKGSTQRICQNDGTWSGTTTTCEPVQCKDPGKPRNSARRPDKKKFVFEDRIDFQCKTNHTMKGDPFIICQNNKTWTGDAPQCMAPCKDPGIPNGSYRHDHSFKHNNVVRFSCKRNWKMEGAQTIRCNNGRWDHKTPKCLESCLMPANKGNMQLLQRKSRYFNGEEVTFNCNRGYKRIGYQRITCLNGKWSSDPPSCKRICSNPGRPNHGLISGFQFFEGKEISFLCYSGYDLFGSKTIRCLLNGQWNASRPECKRRCYNPLIPSNGPTSNPPLFRGYRTRHGTTITFSCRPRYTLLGLNTIRCENGQWSDSNVPVCKAPCSDPGTLQHGQKFGSNFLHGNQVNYRCLGRYTLVGATRLTCNDGRWAPPKPSCKAPCSDPGSPAKGYKTGIEYLHGKSVSYTCKRGTRLVGRSTSTCNNGGWSNPLPRCLEICPVLKNPKNGYIPGRKSEYLSGDKATFQCNSRRYDLFGNKEITCIKGKWSGEIPFCIGRCQVPSNLDYGVKSEPPVSSRQMVKHGTRVSFSCWDNNKLVDGEREVTCDEGSWSSPYPTCKVPCSDPGPIRNGTRRSTNFTVEYECFQGYTLVGSSQRNCVGGRWTPDAPNCLKNCLDPGSPTNGVKTGTDYRHDQRVLYRCTGRTRLRGRSSLTCNNGQWSSPVPKCLEKCPTPSRATNGRYLINGNGGWEYLSGDKVVYQCYPAYDLVGKRELYCDRGRWNGSAPICADRCYMRQLPTGVKATGFNFSSSSWRAQRFRHGTVLTFFCDGNKVLNGAKKISCNKGRWNKDFPKCEVPCKSLAPISNGKMQGSQFEVRFECDSGYSLDGNSVITCKKGNWSSGPPRCMRDCLHPISLNNGKVTGSKYQHGQSISFDCHYGFRLKGSKVLVCNNGNWNDTIPTCIGVCASLVAPKNGELLDNNFDHNARVRFKCNKGYDIIGSKVIMCLNGIWNNNPPVCKSRCSDPGIPRNGRRIGDSFKHQDIVGFSCNQGYEMFGDIFTRCYDGNWSNPNPTCEAGCPDPGIPTGMTRKGFSSRSRSSLTYSCVSQFQSISGNAVITCKDGNWSDSVPTCSDCASALGMKSGKIPDGNIQASSTRWGYHAKDGRLNGQYAWCSGSARDPHLQIDFGKPYRITGLATQGSAYDNKWVGNYTVGSNLAGSSFNVYREDNRVKIFIGNRDKGSVVKKKLRHPFVARSLRIYPRKEGGFSSLSPACMRVEIYGCDLPSDCVMVGSRVVAKWVSYQVGVSQRYIYLKAYRLKSTTRRYWNIVLENENQGNPVQKYFPKYGDLPLVLDVPPRHQELQVGSRVLAPWGYRYFSGTIKTGKDGKNKYRVRADDNDERDFTIDQIRLLKAPTFCN